MALQMNYYYKALDLTLYNAYWKINPNCGILGGKNKITYTIEVFKNAEQTRVEMPQCLEAFKYSFVPNLKAGAPNLIRQAYDHAKCTAQFIGSVDV